MKIRNRQYVALTILLFALVSCTGFDQRKAEEAIHRYVQTKFHNPGSFRAKRYYPAQRIEISEEDARTANSILSDRNAEPFNCWIIAVDIEALTTEGSKSDQSASFSLNVSCDSVISSDVAPYFLRE